MKTTKSSLVIFMIMFVFMVAQSWFLAFSYDTWVAVDGRWVEWALLNVFIAFLSWLFIYRGMCDQRPVMLSKKTK